MASLPELYSNFQINNESENKKKISHSLSNPTKDEFVSASVSTLETVSEYHKNQIHKLKKTITTKQRALTPGKFFSKKLAFFIKQEFSINKDKSAFNLITKKNKILGKNKNAQKSNETDKSSKNIDAKMQEIKKNLIIANYIEKVILTTNHHQFPPYFYMIIILKIKIVFPA